MLLGCDVVDLATESFIPLDVHRVTLVIHGPRVSPLVVGIHWRCEALVLCGENVGLNCVDAMIILGNIWVCRCGISNQKRCITCSSTTPPSIILPVFFPPLPCITGMEILPNSRETMDFLLFTYAWYHNWYSSRCWDRETMEFPMRWYCRPTCPMTCIWRQLKTDACGIGDVFSPVPASFS